MKISLFLLLLGCQTPAEKECPQLAPCPVTDCTYDDVTLDDCEDRLLKCNDGKTFFEHQSKDCIQNLLKQKKPVPIPKKKRGKK